MLVSRSVVIANLCTYRTLIQPFDLLVWSPIQIADPLISHVLCYPNGRVRPCHRYL
jgi:hypothetical protein